LSCIKPQKTTDSLSVWQRKPFTANLPQNKKWGKNFPFELGLNFTVEWHFFQNFHFFLQHFYLFCKKISIFSSSDEQTQKHAWKVFIFFSISLWKIFYLIFLLSLWVRNAGRCLLFNPPNPENIELFIASMMLTFCLLNKRVHTQTNRSLAFKMS